MSAEVLRAARAEAAHNFMQPTCPGIGYLPCPGFRFMPVRLRVSRRTIPKADLVALAAFSHWLECLTVPPLALSHTARAKVSVLALEVVDFRDKRVCLESEGGGNNVTVTLRRLQLGNVRTTMWHLVFSMLEIPRMRNHNRPTAAAVTNDMSHHAKGQSLPRVCTTILSTQHSSLAGAAEQIFE